MERRDSFHLNSPPSEYPLRDCSGLRKLSAAPKRRLAGAVLTGCKRSLGRNLSVQWGTARSVQARIAMQIGIAWILVSAVRAMLERDSPTLMTLAWVMATTHLCSLWCISLSPRAHRTATAPADSPTGMLVPDISGHASSWARRRSPLFKAWPGGGHDARAQSGVRHVSPGKRA